MGSSQRGAFKLNDTYAFLEDGGKAPLIVTDADFWRDLMSEKPTSPGAALVAGGSGWLVAIYSITEDARAWEMHPSGDELLAMLAGGMDVILEQANREVTITLEAGQSCLVPRGTWHRQVVRRPGEYLGATYGKGTLHRPR
jgi:mannose-6-phosphate isomerase-like protein (cupin superfamily)